MKKLVQFKDIAKSFDGQTVLKDIDLDIYENEFVTLLGPSGCGKTTLLRILSGFLQPDGGSVLFDGENITNLPPYQRDLNTVFQNYALFPHMNVYENVAFGLKMKKKPKDIIEQKVTRMLKLVGLDGYKKRSINQLSGGQQQRVAIARALVNEPRLLLLDEPLSALDAGLRKEMQSELKKIQREVGITFIFVTHDQEEALTMSDKIVVMKCGQIQQIGSPIEIYNEPANRYVAGFIGTSNIVDGTMLEDRRVTFADKVFECKDTKIGSHEPVDVVIRPEDIDIVDENAGQLNGIVKSVQFKGIYYEVVVETKAGTSIEVTMTVSDHKPVINEKAGEMMSASDFYLDAEDVETITDAYIIDRANAMAWNTRTQERISIAKVEHDVHKENGTYPVAFFTAAGTRITANMIVEAAKRAIDNEHGEEIYAVNFFKNVNEIKDSIALHTDLKIWANAFAYRAENDNPVEITDVEYDFDPETITEGQYTVTFRTHGYEWRVYTTEKYKNGDAVGLLFDSDDIHLMRKSIVQES